jgi:predicted nucleic acid-binding protein
MRRLSEEVVFLDTNVVMYAVGTEHPYRLPCQQVMSAIANGTLRAAIDTETVQEILHRYGALRRYAEAVAIAQDLLSVVDLVYPVTLRDIQRALELFSAYSAQGVQARDTIHAAVMQNNGIRAIISADRHFDLIEGIERIDPQECVESLLP